MEERPELLTFALISVHMQDPVVHYRHRLMDNITRSGMKFRAETPGDGNCFFHAISDQLDRLQLPAKHAKELRTMLVKYLQDLPLVINCYCINNNL